MNGHPHPPTEEQAILEERARALARERESDATDSGAEQVLEFQAGGECYGIGLGWVRETRRTGTWMRVPGAPEFVLGIVSVRGQILSLIDLPRLLGLGSSAGSDDGFLIRLGGPQMECCVRADSVAGLRRVGAEELQDPGRLLPEAGPGLIRGVTAHRLFLLDGGRLLDHVAPDPLDPDRRDGTES